MTILTFNRGLSAVVGKEMHSDLTELRNSLPKSLPWDAAIAERIEKLSRIARTAQLRTVYKVLHQLAAGSRLLNTSGTDTLQDATTKLLQALITHLNEVVQEHKNTPLRMAKPLQGLMAQLGQQVSPVLSAELFMPFTPEDVSADRPSALPVAEFANAIRDYRAAYQEGLIKLLKEGDTSQYGALRQALVSIEPKNPHMGYRIFFESAIATLDILNKTTELDNLAKWILSKIDPELHNIVNGSVSVNDDLLSSMLHFIARADADTSARVRKLQDQFNLKSYMADLNGIDPAIVEKFTQVLVRSREVWSQFAANEPNRVAKLIAELQSKSALLKNPGFTIVIDALHEVITAIAEGKATVNGDQLSLEGAGALLVLEQQLRDGANLNTANLSASRLFGLIGKATNYVASGVEPQTATAILHVLAAQIQDDLNQLEPRLLEFLNDQRDGEQELRTGLKKISKILDIFGKGNSLSNSFALFESRLEVPSYTNEKADVATQFTQLNTLVESLKTSDKTAMSAATRWLEAQANAVSPTEGDEFKDAPNDSEMLEIFLEEATGILMDVEKWLSQLRSDPSMHDTVVNLRRGYHTLKGSGRMVGLVRFGDLAYIGELLLNNWIASKKIPTPELLDFFKKSIDGIAVHVENFKEKGFSFVDYASTEQEALALGGTALTEAPQSKRASVKLNSGRATTAPAPAPTPVMQDMPMLKLEPITMPSPALVLTPEPVEQPTFLIPQPTFEVEPASEEPVSADLTFEVMTTTSHGLPLVPELPALPTNDELPQKRVIEEEVHQELPELKMPAPKVEVPVVEPVVPQMKPKATRPTPPAWQKNGTAAPAKAPAAQPKQAGTTTAKPAVPKPAVKKVAPPPPVKLGFFERILAWFKKK